MGSIFLLGLLDLTAPETNQHNLGQHCFDSFSSSFHRAPARRPPPQVAPAERVAQRKLRSAVQKASKGSKPNLLPETTRRRES